MLYALTDHLGTVRDLVSRNSTTGSVLVRKHTEFDSFGQITGETYYDTSGNVVTAAHAEAVEQLFGYTGHPLDETTGLNVTQYRHYDPTVGQWLSIDPTGFDAGDANLYRYVGNKVTGYVDPDGLEMKDGAHWKHGGDWWLRDWTLHFSGHYGETSAGKIKPENRKWSNFLNRNTAGRWLGAGTIYLFEICGTLQLKDEIINGDQNIPVEISIQFTLPIKLKFLNRISYISAMTRGLGIKSIVVSGAATYQLVDGAISLYLSSREFWEDLKEVSRRTKDLNRLYKILDTERADLHVSPSVICETGVSSIKIDAKGINLPMLKLGFGDRYEGRSYARPWDDPWNDGIWNADKTFPMEDLELPLPDIGVDDAE